MFKQDKVLTRKVLFDLAVEHIFNGDNVACDEWWYGNKITGLSNMTLSDLCNTYQGKLHAMAYIEGFYEGIKARSDV